jgi:hypothetical protein
LTPAFITVIVEEHEDLPEGCCMRFKAVGSPRLVRRLRLELGGPRQDENDDSPHEWIVEACGEHGELGPAHGVIVEDSSAGSSTLIYGGARGLRLRPAEGQRGGGDGGSDGNAIAEPYLLVAERALLE